jgi:hypothetical protein
MKQTPAWELRYSEDVASLDRGAGFLGRCSVLGVYSRTAFVAFFCNSSVIMLQLAT